MRIISGSARGRKLAGFSGKSIRPTSDRVREAVFSSIFSQAGHFESKCVLDLFAGTGAMGIEALSRGAEKAVFVDQSRESGKLIEQNLESTSLRARGFFQQGKALDVLRHLGKNGESFDLIFIDPPYALDPAEELLQAVNHFGLLRTDGMICFESSGAAQIPDRVDSLRCYDQRTYGSTTIRFFKHDIDGDDA